MKKILIVALFLFPFFARAEVPSGTFGFMDGKFYDQTQSLKYLCFLDNNCYDLNGKFAFSREPVGSAPTLAAQPSLQGVPVIQPTPSPIAPATPMFEKPMGEFMTFSISLEKDSVSFYDNYLLGNRYGKSFSKTGDLIELTFNDQTYTQTFTDSYMNFIIGNRSGSLNYTPLTPNTSYSYTLKITRGDTFGTVSGTLTTLE